MATLEKIAAMCSHVPGKSEYEQMIHYCGHYSNASRGKRKKTDADDKIPCQTSAFKKQVIIKSGLSYIIEIKVQVLK
jgi:hypothetical protein